MKNVSGKMTYHLLIYDIYYKEPFICTSVPVT